MTTNTTTKTGAGISAAHAINLTPSWSGLIPAMIAVLRNPEADTESIEIIQGELLKLARYADAKVEKDALREIVAQTDGRNPSHVGQDRAYSIALHTLRESDGGSHE